MKFIRRQIQQCAPLQDAKRLLVAVSGGPDSIVLLDALCRERFSVVIAHCNFHIRGEASDEDAQFVRQLSDRYQVPYCQVDFDTEKIAEERKVSIEMAARDLRYEWFEQMADEHDCDQLPWLIMPMMWSKHSFSILLEAQACKVCRAWLSCVAG